MAEGARGTPWLLVSHRMKKEAGEASPVIPRGAENPLWEVQSSLGSLGYFQKMQSQLSKAEKDEGLLKCAQASLWQCHGKVTCEHRAAISAPPAATDWDAPWLLH